MKGSGIMCLPSLVGKQTEILYVPDNRSMLITGSAGSGKSLLAIYRAYWLAEIHPDESIILLTFNKPVNDDMKEKLKALVKKHDSTSPKNLKIQTYHGFMLSIINELCNKYYSNLTFLKKYLLNLRLSK